MKLCFIELTQQIFGNCWNLFLNFCRKQDFWLSRRGFRRQLFFGRISYAFTLAHRLLFIKLQLKQKSCTLLKIILNKKQFNKNRLIQLHHIVPIKSLFYNFIPKQMYNKYSGIQNRYKYLPTTNQTLFSELQRRNYNHVINKLNSENEYLSRNMKELIIQNMALKNKLYHVRDNTYRTKQNGKNDVAQQMQRLHGFSASPQARRRPERSPLWKKKQQKQEKKRQNYRKERQSSPGNSDLKRETIIEELSQSNFQSKTQTPTSKREKKGLFLSKKAERPQKPAQKMIKSVDAKRRQPLNLQVDQIQEKGESGFLQESETQQIVVPQEEPQSNPQKVASTPPQKSKNKKDNSPYLQMTNLGPKTSANIYPQASQKTQASFYSPNSSLREKHSNKAYLAYAK